MHRAGLLLALFYGIAILTFEREGSSPLTLMGSRRRGNDKTE